jgi:hypothetical protein
VQNFVQTLAKAISRNDKPSPARKTNRNEAQDSLASAFDVEIDEKFLNTGSLELAPDSAYSSRGYLASLSPSESKARSESGKEEPAKDANGQPVMGVALHPGILGTVGEEFAHDLTQAMEQILYAVANPRSYGVSLSRTHFMVEALRRKAMALQQISRLAQNRVRQSHEKLSLPDAIKGVLEDRHAEYVATGLVVNSRFKPVDIIVDPGLLVNLIATALDWITEFGTVVRVSTSMKEWPKHGQLHLKAAQGVRTQDDVDLKTAVNQSIAWHLLQQIAQSMGVGLEIQETLNDRNLVIDFPRTVVALEGMTMMEMEAPSSNAESSFGSISPNYIAGHSVLLISPDYEFFAQVREICKTMSLRCDQAPSVQMAERMCEQQVPHLIICEEDLMDDQYEDLLDDLNRHSPGFPTIVVGEDAHGFELSDWSGNNKSRVARKEIKEQLPNALTIELTRSL